ncbi:MAG TPA: hypothetical protein VMA77_03390 [Solirubrobacteraceae bacterium]|nr:hypothetical protein [Solirubrobacteraceae bacterium]
MARSIRVVAAHEHGRGHSPLGSNTREHHREQCQAPQVLASHPGKPAPAADDTDNPPLAAVPAVNGDSPGPHAGNPPPAARRSTNDEFPDTTRSTPATIAPRSRRRPPAS